MHIHVQLRRKHVFLLAGAMLLLAIAGTAYATIPDSNGVYTACRLNGLGTIRLIDPSGPSTSFLSHCTSLETQISWNQKGQKGDTGAPGANGVNGVSPTVTPLSVGDSNCPTGGAAITGANGATAYVCSGQNGKDGQPFAGTFTSLSHQFSLSITDSGIELAGPDAKISMPSSGGVTVSSTGTVLVKGDNLNTVANNENVTVSGSRAEHVGADENITVSGNRSETVGSTDNVTVGGNRTESLGADESITVAGNRTESVAKGETITVQGNRTEKVGNGETVTVGGNRTETVDSSENITVHGNRTETVDGGLGVLASGPLNLGGAFVGINAATACEPAARVHDLVDTAVGQILTGSPTVCIG